MGRSRRFLPDDFMSRWCSTQCILGKTNDINARYVYLLLTFMLKLCTWFKFFPLGRGVYEDIGTMLEKYPHMNQYWEDKNPKIANIEIPIYALMSYSTDLHTEGSFRGWKYSSSKDKWYWSSKLGLGLHN